MANRDRPVLTNQVREERTLRGWSQEELARRSGLSRAGVSAVEMHRLAPSAAAALALASALGVRVEELFALVPPASEGPGWAWAPPRGSCRFWRAEVAGRVWFYPVEASTLGSVCHDGVRVEGRLPRGRARFDGDPKSTLVIACCDPAAGLLADELARSSGVRLIVLSRSSRSALELLAKGLVHAAGVHLGGAGTDGSGNVSEARALAGPGHSLLRAADWEEGVAFSGATRLKTAGEAARRSLRWVGRETGSGARQCLDDLLGHRAAPTHLARDHRGVAEAIRSGWAEAGVCLRLASEEAGLDFLPVRREAYDLCIADATQDDPRIVALLKTLRAPAYRRCLGELPGYDSAHTGTLRRVI